MAQGTTIAIWEAAYQKVVYQLPAPLLNCQEDIVDYDENKKRMKSLVEDLHVIEIWSLMKLCREKLGQNNELMDYEKQLIKDGHFLMAVKSVRLRTCLGLRECKQICDKYDEELKQSQACV